MSNLDVPPNGAWLVRGGRDDEMVTAFEQQGAIALQWHNWGELPAIPTLEEFKTRLFQQLSTTSSKEVSGRVQELFYFARLMAVDDYILMDDKRVREVVMGRVTAPLEYNIELFGQEYPYVHRVEWLKRIPRKEFTSAAQRDLYSILSVYDIKSHLREIHGRVKGEAIDDEIDLEAIARRVGVGKRSEFEKVVEEFVEELWDDFLKIMFELLYPSFRAFFWFLVMQSIYSTNALYRL